MLWTIFVILLVLWAVGMVSSYTLGGFIHILLLIALAVVLIRIIQGRRPQFAGKLVNDVHGLFHQKLGAGDVSIQPCGAEPCLFF